MAGALDHQVGMVAEVTYGTALTVTRFYEWDLDQSEHQWDPKRVQGSGMQVGDGGFGRADRSVSVLGQGAGKIGLDYQTKGMGVIVESLFGTGVSTLVSGSTFQQLFTSNLVGSLLPARTVQYGIVRSDTGGTVDAYTYAGVTFPKMTLKCAAGEVLKGEFEWDARSQTKATGLATASYPAGLLEPFHYGQVSEVTYGGAVTVPTTTALKSGGTAVTNFRSFEMELDDNADIERWSLGGTRNQPRIAKRECTLKVAAEYDAVVYDDALVNHTSNPFTITWTSSQALSTGFATLQLVFPATKITAGARPSPTTETPVTELELEVLKPASGHAVYLVHRTADTTL